MESRVVSLRTSRLLIGAEHCHIILVSNSRVSKAEVTYMLIPTISTEHSGTGFSFQAKHTWHYPVEGGMVGKLKLSGRGRKEGASGTEEVRG